METEGKVKERSARTYTLPKGVVDDLYYIACSLGVSQSAFLAEMIEEPLRDLREMIEATGPPMVPTLSVMRLRGASAHVVAERVREALARLREVSE
jgi:hypothetical protein